MSNPERKLRVVTEGNCPCGGQFKVVYVTRPGKKEEERASMHSEPSCLTFKTKGMDEYLSWVRMQEQN